MKAKKIPTPEELEFLQKVQALAVQLCLERLRYAASMRQGIGAPLMPERGRPCLWLVN